VKTLFFIPIEVKARELDSRLLIALGLVAKGATVVIGEKSQVNRFAQRYEFGTYLAKSMSANDLKWFTILKQHGHRIAVLDEEAIIHQNKDAHVRSRFDATTLDLVNLSLSWGKYDFCVANKYFPQYQEKFCISGNPRMDLLRHEMQSFFAQQVDSIREQYSRYIIVPSSFAMCNHYTEPGARIAWRKKMGMIKTSNDISFYEEYANHFTNIFEQFLNDIPKILKKFGDINIIIRPHPSENRYVWEERFKNEPNIFVVSQGSVVPWLIASDLVIHNGCTTAIEAFLVGKGVISYRPFIKEEYDLKLPNSISHQVTSYQELEESISDFLSNNIPDQYTINGQKILDRYLSSYKEGAYAYENIVNQLIGISETSSRKRVFRSLLDGFEERVRHMTSRVGERGNYSKQKFNSLTRTEIEERINCYPICAIQDSNIEISKAVENVFILKCLAKRD